MTQYEDQYASSEPAYARPNASFRYRHIIENDTARGSSHQDLPEGCCLHQRLRRMGCNLHARSCSADYVKLCRRRSCLPEWECSCAMLERIHVPRYVPASVVLHSCSEITVRTGERGSTFPNTLAGSCIRSFKNPSTPEHSKRLAYARPRPPLTFVLAAWVLKASVDIVAHW